jgi:predicted aspartyl protease
MIDRHHQLRKNMRLSGLCCIVCSLIMSSSAKAECRLERAASLPLRLEQHAIVQASLNGHLVPMMVDTGAQRSSVTPETYSALGLQRDSNKRTRLNTVAGEEITQDALVETLKLGDLSFSDRGVLVVPLSREGAPDHTAGGVIGTDLISDFDVDFDFPHATMTLYRPGHCTEPPWTGPYETIPIYILPNREVGFPVKLNGQPFHAIFDTGSSSETVMVTSAKRIGISGSELAADPSASGTSAGERYVAHRHRFESLDIGGQTFHDVQLDVVDFKNAGTDMLVGLDYMRSRRFFLSYSAETLLVQQPGTDQSSRTNAKQATGRDERCPVPADFRPRLSPITPVAISRPNFAPPESWRQNHIDGCAGVAFHLTAGGTTADLKLIVERPLGYGLGDFVLRQLAATQYLPPGGSPDQLYYEAHRFFPAPASKSSAK